MGGQPTLGIFTSNGVIEIQINGFIFENSGLLAIFKINHAYDIF
jgi:hypothetical protein